MDKKRLIIKSGDGITLNAYYDDAGYYNIYDETDKVWLFRIKSLDELYTMQYSDVLTKCDSFHNGNFGLYYTRDIKEMFRFIYDGASECECCMRLLKLVSEDIVLNSVAKIGGFYIYTG